MNREEVDHGCSPEESEKVEIEKEGQESCGEKEDGPEALLVEEKVHRKEKEENRTQKSSREEKIDAEEVNAEDFCPKEPARDEVSPRCSCAPRLLACRRADHSHLSSVQPAGG